MRNLFNSKFKVGGLATAFVLLFGLAYMAGTISTSRNNAFAQSITTAPGQTATPATQPATSGQSGTAAPESTDGTGAAETADGPEGGNPADSGAADSGAADSAGPEVDNPAALQAQAIITADQAKQAALAKVPGTAVSVSLEDENGKAVYAVVVNPTAGGANQEVKVSATDGSVLKVDAGEQEETGGAEN